MTSAHRSKPEAGVNPAECWFRSNAAATDAPTPRVRLLVPVLRSRKRSSRQTARSAANQPSRPQRRRPLPSRDSSGGTHAPAQAKAAVPSGHRDRDSYADRRPFRDLPCTNLDSLVGLADVTALVEERQHRCAGVPDVADAKQQRGLGEPPLLLLHMIGGASTLLQCRGKGAAAPPLGGPRARRACATVWSDRIWGLLACGSGAVRVATIHSEPRSSRGALADRPAQPRDPPGRAAASPPI